MDKNRVLQCSAVEEPDMVNENHLEEGEGRGDKMKMPQTVERTAGRQAGSSFGSTPLRAFYRRQDGLQLPKVRWSGQDQNMKNMKKS